MAEITKTLGGDRLGAGGKQKQRLHNYERSTHDLSESFKSSATVGLLYPCYTNIGLNGDTFEIKIDAGCKTIPTRGPLFGSFKMQVDVFSIPIRLYHGILHNNPLNIGLKMNQVQLPTFIHMQRAKTENESFEQYANEFGYNPSCLEKYLGLSGIGINRTNAEDETSEYRRELPCIYELAYYDIFKNYYANKQEKNAYVVSYSPGGRSQSPNKAVGLNIQGNEITATSTDLTEFSEEQDVDIANIITNQDTYYLEITGVNLSMTNIYLTINNPNYGPWSHSLEEWKNSGMRFTLMSEDKIIINISNYKYFTRPETTYTLRWNAVNTSQHLHLEPFELTNIDEMRYTILGFTLLGEHLKFGPRTISQDVRAAIMPYRSLIGKDENGHSVNTHPLVGLMCKTYQSDLFNNWVQTEWIDGDNGINAITAVQTSDGKFTIDALNLANKVYNMLNRIAISGGTYQDWQEAVYAEKAVRHAETPIYLGGMSSEVTFDEVVSMAATSEDALGTLGGRGRLAGKKGGKIIVKCTEPSIIMAIMSFTPRIEQTQGNAWYRTEINTLDDLHKPSLDQIGFQDLLEEPMAWWSTSRGELDGEPENFKPAIGKVPAWINYMTAVDKAYGDFAATEGKAFMVLSRNYTIDEEDGTIKDATTYIDPTKYNYAFAYSALDSQNLWVQVYFDVKARRKMSAKQIPNL